MATRTDGLLLLLKASQEAACFFSRSTICFCCSAISQTCPVGPGLWLPRHEGATPPGFRPPPGSWPVAWGLPCPSSWDGCLTSLQCLSSSPLTASGVLQGQTTDPFNLWCQHTPRNFFFFLAEPLIIAVLACSIIPQDPAQ